MALPAALNYGLAGVERGEQDAIPIPPTLYSQARMAARANVGLETVLRRYVAGNSVLTDFIFQEAETGNFVQDATLRAILRSQAVLLDRLIGMVSEEYTREASSWLSSTGQRELKRVKQLLDGELIDVSGLNYEFDASHVGLIAEGLRAADTLRGFAAELDKRILEVHPSKDITWAWLGSRHGMTSTELDYLCRKNLPREVLVAVGEPAEGIEGWRLTHRQARAALHPAESRQNPVRYSDVALDASLSRDDLLAASLRRLYLAPLERTGDGGRGLLEALRAYFACDRNVSSTAASLKLDRRTVANRLQTVERLLERPVRAVAPQLELALRLYELDDSSSA